MSLAEDVKLSAYWEAAQGFFFSSIFLKFIFQNKYIVEERYYEGRTRKKSREQASKSPNEFF